MLGADSVNLAMMIADSGVVDSAVNELMMNTQLMLVVENQGVDSSIKNHLMKWQNQVKTRMTKVCEAERFQQELALYQQVIHWDEVTFSSVFKTWFNSWNGIQHFILRPAS